MAAGGKGEPGRGLESLSLHQSHSHTQTQIQSRAKVRSVAGPEQNRGLEYDQNACSTSCTSATCGKDLAQAFDEVYES